MPSGADRTLFSLSEARALLPKVKALTAEAVGRAEVLTARLRDTSEDDPAREELAAALRDSINAWADEVRSLGVEVKGLWLVDFDNGEGYYCWRHPEETISHYHGYEDGFAGRMSIQ